ncbi:MAG: glycoside hydrolase family 28 protein [Pirellulales bacterium]|nr:glycoside hydrolase family 28 protein [Pirellulales bacterium]
MPLRLSASLTLVLLAIGAVVRADEAIPTRDQTGPAAMPRDVAPIVAPFEMPTPRRPKFPPRTVSIVDCGAIADRGKLATTAIQQAIDRVAAAGGGTALVPAGRWQTGRIVLRSRVNLHLAAGAVLEFSDRIEDYLPPVFTRYEGIELMSAGGLIYARGAEGCAVTGSGELLGPKSGPLREARPGLSDELVDPQSPVEDRVFDGRQGRHYFRPYFITLVECRDVLVEGVALRRGPMWNIVPIACDGVLVRGVTIDSRGVVNGDGIDVESSRNVLVEYCSVDTGDDCYVLKAGRNADGLRTARPVENVVFRRNYAAGGIGGVTCGSETAGGIRRVHVHDCVFEGVKHAIYLKTRRPRGGGGEQLSFERIRFTTQDHAVFCDMLGAPMFVGELAERLPPRPLTPSTPYYRDVTIRGLAGSCQGEFVKVKGIPESPLTRFTVEDATVASRGLLNLTDVRQFAIRRSRIVSRDPTITLNAVRGFAGEEVAVEATARPRLVKDEDEIAGAAEIEWIGSTPPLDAWQSD